VNLLWPALLSALLLGAVLGTVAGPVAAGEPARQLDAVEVTTDRYQRVPPPPVPRFMVGLPLFNFKFGFGWPEMLGPYVVTASRTPQPPEHVAATLRVFDGPALQQAPAVTLDGVLRGLPGFSLFRRSDSLTANPTAQGVSLRGLGPSGASRSLVLLDGVPLNDPFGGWVAWSKLPREGLFRAEVVPGGGAAAWGNAALSGVVQFFAVPVRTSLVIVDEPPKPMGWGSQGSARVALAGGSFGTRSAEVAVTAPAGREIVQLLGRTFATEGYAVVAPERRGAIDVPAWSRHRWAQGRWRHAFASGLEFTLTARHFEENRGNGTPYTRNGTREKFAALTVAAQPADHFAWNLVAYGQDQCFASTFSSVNATRSAETPASDQFAVPAAALGFAWTGAWKHAGSARTSAGADLRSVRGETREHYSFTGGRFTRLRVAGGRQQFRGLFALHERPFADGWRATAGARLDSWTDTDGHRRESDRDTAAVLRADEYPGQQGTEFSPNVGLVWAASPSWRLRANAQHAFRRPTLNELYRPFRQGANVTEANAALRTERVLSSEVGAERTWWRPAPPAPSARPGTAARGKPYAALVLSAVVFRNELRDAVGNVTLARGPGTFPIVGTLAAGGLGRQRLNLDRTRVQGLELAAKWTPWPAVTFSGDVLLNDASVRAAARAPALVGQRVAQVPRRSAAVGAVWRAPGAVVITPRVRYTGRQFEDDENQLTLGAVVVAEVSASRALTKRVEAFVTAENLANARVETGRSADGVVNVGTPRLVLVGLRGAW
jgi:outer membrane receptor protein involved in Fe transport